MKIFLFCFYKIWFEPMFLAGFFAVLIRAALPLFGFSRGDFLAAAGGEEVFPYLSALRAAESVGQKSESLIVVELYNSARTFFE